MSKTALLGAFTTFDLDKVRTALARNPELMLLQDERGLNLLQLCCRRSTAGDAAAAGRQLRLAKWLVGEGFDPRAIYTFAAGTDGEEDAAAVSLVWFAVAKAQNNRLARYFLEQGAGTAPIPTRWSARRRSTWRSRCSSAASRGSRAWRGSAWRC
jgi:hypothetical protein